MTQEDFPFDPEPAPPETANPPVDDPIEDAPTFLVDPTEQANVSPGYRIAGKFPHPADETSEA